MSGDWGFTPWSQALYGLTPDVIADRKDHYLSDVQSERLLACNPHWETYMNKVDAQVNGEAGTFAQRYAWADDGNLFGMPYVDSPCVVKPISGNQGWGVRLRPEGISNGMLRTLAVTDDFIVEEALQNHSYASEIWPHSSNTIRILTYHDGQSAQVAASVHKWGTNHSGWLDNFTQGGLTTYIQGGIMGYTLEDYSPLELRRNFSGDRCGSDRKGFYNHSYRYDIHPESGARILGKQIPFWREAVAMVLRSAETYHANGWLNYIGYDVIITPDGPRIVELNPEPGVHLIQMHIPLMVNQRFKRFVEQWTI